MRYFSSLFIFIINFVSEKKNITKEEETVFQVPRFARNKQPFIKEIPQELKIQLIATENIASGIYNETTENYEALHDKVWQVWIPRGCRMVMFFTEFELESSPNCSKDFFSIQTSKKQQDIVKYCGSVGEIANKTISIRNRRRVQMQFHSDENHTRRGVKAAYCFQDLKTYDPDVPCGCNADTSAVRRRQTRKAKGKDHSKSHTEKSHSKKHNTKTHTHTKSKSKADTNFSNMHILTIHGFLLIGDSKHAKARLNKDLLFAMQSDQVCLHPIIAKLITQLLVSGETWPVPHQNKALQLNSWFKLCTEP